MEFLTNLSQGTQFTLQLLIVLGCLFYGARKGGIALGLLGGIGLLAMVFLFHIQPGKPAITVMLVILAVVVASATLQASGGLDCMLQIAEKALRKHPKYVSIVAGFVTCTLTVLCGTGHVVYTVLPIIYDVAIKNNIRPERPMAAGSVSAQMGIIASPVSVAVVSLTGFLEPKIADFGYLDLLKITIPATYCGVLAIGLFSMFRGKDLDKDQEYQEKMKDPEFRHYVYGENDGASLIGVKLESKKWTAMWIFLGIVALVAILGYFKDYLLPAWPDPKKPEKLKPMAMTDVIQLFMLLAGALIIIFTKTDANKISRNEIFRSGMIALVAVFGISWMAETMFSVHTQMFKDTLGSVIKAHPWTYALMLLLISKFVNSQAAAISAFVPIALGIGVNPGIIAAFAPACYGYYILPTYPSDLAAIQFDRTGTTHIGKFVINHSFIIPGLIGVFTSCVIGYILAGVYGYL